MHLKGKHKFNASPEQIWSILMDADTLARITPGVTRLEEIETDQYKAIADVKIGPVKGAFTGKLDVADKEAPKSFVLKVKQDSKIGNVSADVHIGLSPESAGQTELSFDGNARLSGLLARTGQRVLSGVANTLTKQFFKALEEEVSQRADS
jgi:carbon monoxide dehydrogenase subunit G